MKFKLKLILSLLLVVTISTPISFACTNIIVTRGASVDGSILVSYSADSPIVYGELYYSPAQIYSNSAVREVYEWETNKYLCNIPQVASTYQRVGNMNEHQLIITETTFGGRSELQNTEGLIDYGSLIYITLERAKTAREAINLMGELVKEHGYHSSGESFSIADTEEAWVMELIGKGEGNKGAVWVAVRIPDGYISAHANQSRIDTFPLNDPENCIYSPDVISFAKDKGYYKGKDKDFSFCDAYAPIDFGGARFCEARTWSAFNQAGCDVDQYLDFAMGENLENKMPLYMKAPEKLSVKDVADFMRDHYEGTPMDMRSDIGAGGNEVPYRWRPLTFKHEGAEYFNERAISTQQTGWWMVGQSRSWLPNEVGGILWFGVDAAATSCLTPIYVSTKETPLSLEAGNGDLLNYSTTAAFWIFNRVAQFAYLRYNDIHPDLKKSYDAHENSAIENVQAVDKVALALIESGKKEQAISFLTDYTVRTADDMFDMWCELDRYLMVKFIDGYVKQEDANGFIDNGNGPSKPVSPKNGGYSKKWIDAVTRESSENGDRLKMK